MKTSEFQGDPEFRSWLDRLIEDKVREELSREHQRVFRESFAIIPVRPECYLSQSIARYRVSVCRPADFSPFGRAEKRFGELLFNQNYLGDTLAPVLAITGGQFPETHQGSL